MNSSVQYDTNGKLKHLLSLEDLPKQLIEELFDRAANFIDEKTGRIKKSHELANKMLVTAFFEPSTRTRLAFEIAAKSLGAEVVNFDAENSALAAKGESFQDTLKTIAALGADFIVVRLGQDGELEKITKILPNNVSLLSGGEGCNDHPSQGLLDAWTIVRAKKNIEHLRIAIVGDVIHSRVARSLTHALSILGCKELVMCGPEKLVPSELENSWGVKVEHDIEKAVTKADVVYCLRFQYERMANEDKAAVQVSTSDHTLNAHRLSLAKEDAVVLHPGPINREVEITSQICDGPQSLILKQVTHGVAMRMAIMSMLATS